MIFEVRRDDLRSAQWIDEVVTDLADGGVRLRVDLFALTANNVTYAVFGDAMRYWGFFPASEGWGRVPVWGFADVEASRVDGLAVGDRVYGYLPMATHVDVMPAHVTANGFVDGVEHRSALPPVYNQYQRVGRDGRERETAILRPLFTTSFLITTGWTTTRSSAPSRSCSPARRARRRSASPSCSRSARASRSWGSRRRGTRTSCATWATTTAR